MVAKAQRTQRYFLPDVCELFPCNIGSTELCPNVRGRGVRKERLDGSLVRAPYKVFVRKIDCLPVSGGMHRVGMIVRVQVQCQVYLAIVADATRPLSGLSGSFGVVEDRQQE